MLFLQNRSHITFRRVLFCASILKLHAYKFLLQWIQTFKPSITKSRSIYATVVKMYEGDYATDISDFDVSLKENTKVFNELNMRALD